MRTKNLVPAVLAASVLACAPQATLAQSLDDIPDEATVVEDYLDQIVTFPEFDTYSPSDPTPQIFGIIDNLMEGETIFGEVFLDTPLPQDELRSLREAGDPISVRCDRVRVIEVQTELLFAGEGCEIVAPSGDRHGGGA